MNKENLRKRVNDAVRSVLDEKVVAQRVAQLFGGVIEYGLIRHDWRQRRTSVTLLDELSPEPIHTVVQRIVKAARLPSAKNNAIAKIETEVANRALQGISYDLMCSITDCVRAIAIKHANHDVERIVAATAAKLRASATDTTRMVRLNHAKGNQTDHL